MKPENKIKIMLFITALCIGLSSCNQKKLSTKKVPTDASKPVAESPTPKVETLDTDAKEEVPIENLDAYNDTSDLNKKEGDYVFHKIDLKESFTDFDFSKPVDKLSKAHEIVLIKSTVGDPSYKQDGGNDIINTGDGPRDLVSSKYLSMLFSNALAFCLLENYEKAKDKNSSKILISELIGVLGEEFIKEELKKETEKEQDFPSESSLFISLMTENWNKQATDLDYLCANNLTPVLERSYKSDIVVQYRITDKKDQSKLNFYKMLITIKDFFENKKYNCYQILKNKCEEEDKKQREERKKEKDQKVKDQEEEAVPVKANK